LRKLAKSRGVLLHEDVCIKSVVYLEGYPSRSLLHLFGIIVEHQIGLRIFAIAGSISSPSERIEIDKPKGSRLQRSRIEIKIILKDPELSTRPWSSRKILCHGGGHLQCSIYVPV